MHCNAFSARTEYSVSGFAFDWLPDWLKPKEYAVMRDRYCFPENKDTVEVDSVRAFSSPDCLVGPVRSTITFDSLLCVDTRGGYQIE